jgi:hypothetical protein
MVDRIPKDLVEGTARKIGICEKSYILARPGDLATGMGSLEVCIFDDALTARLQSRLAFCEGSERSRTSARNTHLVREHDLRDRVLIAGVRIVNIRFGLLQFGLT